MGKPEKIGHQEIDVRWTDSISPVSTWVELDRIGTIGKGSFIQSRGYLVYEDSEWVGLAHSLEMVEGVPALAGGVIMIPKVCVVDLKKRS